MARKRTFLDTEAWKTIPWVKHPETKTPEHRLYDILSMVPGIGEDLNARNRADDDKEIRKALHDKSRAKVKQALTQLTSWRWQWEKDNPHSVSEKPVDPATSLTVDDDGNPLFETILWYSTIMQATEIMLYNCYLMLLLYYALILEDTTIMKEVLASMPQPTMQPNNALMLPTADMQIRDGTHEICRSMEYCLRESNLSIGSLTLASPLRLLSVYLSHSVQIANSTQCHRPRSRSLRQQTPSLGQPHDRPHCVGHGVRGRSEVEVSTTTGWERRVAGQERDSVAAR
jgi:hypothetical protein